MNQTTGHWVRQKGAVVVLLDSSSENHTERASEFDWKRKPPDQHIAKDFQVDPYEERTPPASSGLEKEMQTGQVRERKASESPCPPQQRLPASKDPRDESGCWYLIDRGDNLFKVAAAALERMLVPKGGKATKSAVTAYARCINSHPHNARFRTGKPSSIFSNGSIKPAFLPLWSPADLTSRKRRGEKGTYAAIWLPRLRNGGSICGGTITDPSSPKTDPSKPRPKTDPSKPEPKTPSKPEPWDRTHRCDVYRPALVNAWKEAICSVEFVAKRLGDVAMFSLPKRIAFWNHASSPERRWFGRYDEKRFARIRNIVSGALRALRSEDLLVYCTTLKRQPRCRKLAAIAYRSTNVIQLCPGFFGTTTHDEKVVMLVHEAVHLGGAAIYIERYKLKNTQRLARYRPHAATKNAENYACYVAQVCRLKYARCDTVPADASNTVPSICAELLAPG